MTVLLDHLGAVLVGAVVLLIVFAAQHQTSSTAMEETRYGRHRELARAFAITLEDDLRNVGVGVPPGTATITGIASDSLALRRTLDFNTPDVHDIVYRRTQTGWGVVNQVSVPIYTVDRVVDGVVTLTAPGIVSAFEMELRDSSNAPTTVLDDARAIHVHMELGDIDPATGEVANRARFSRTITPPNL